MQEWIHGWTKQTVKTTEVEVKLEFYFFQFARFYFGKDRHICVTDYTDMINSIFYIYVLNATCGWNSSCKNKKGQFLSKFCWPDQRELKLKLEEPM